MRRGRVQSLAASPTMVGAITTLIVILAVFLAYNASTGLPFVPVYRISVMLPDAQRLLPNNDVFIGGTRVGVVESIEPVVNQQNGQSSARLNLKLDKSVQPLPANTLVRVRYKSAFGLKFLQLTRVAGPPLAEGATIPLSHSSSQVEFDQIADTFDTPTRTAMRANLLGYGNALAARGASLNETIQNLGPLFRNLQPVARILVQPSTRLDRFFPALGRTAALVAPVAAQDAEQFTNLADTFAALSADPAALEQTISSNVSTFSQGTAALAAQHPFLRDFTDLSARLRPGVAALRGALPTLNSALTIGAPVLARTPPVDRKLGQAFAALRSLVRQPQTKTTLLRLRETFGQVAPAATYIAPYQTVCNYWNYWFTNAPNGLAAEDNIGTSFRQAIIGSPMGNTAVQGGGLGGYSGRTINGRAGILPTPPDKPGEFDPHKLPILYGQPYSPAVTKSGAANCQAGQNGYLLGSYRVPGQSPSNPSVGISNLPGAPLGPTFAGRARVPSHLK